MQIHRTIGLFAVSLSALAAAATAVRAETAAPATLASPDACLKTVNALGASMGHTQSKDSEGRVIFKFRLRTAGLDYDATCDAASGIVGEVTPHKVASFDDAS